MDKEQYKEYESDVKAFFDKEGLTNLTMECGDDTDHECGVCGEVVGCDPSFSWSSCDCCGSRLGGDRYHATGYSPTTEQACCYDICPDCVYYAEYGQLDDTTMMGIG